MVLDSRLARNILSMEPVGCEIFDCHAHIGTFVKQYIPFEASAAALVAMMDHLGIGFTCISHNLSAAEDVLTGNRLACEAACQYPGRLGVYLGFNPNLPIDAGLHDLKRHAEGPGVVGIKLHPAAHQTTTADPRYRPALAFAQEHRLIVLSHTWGITDIKGIDDMAGEYPDVPLLMGHSGGYEFAANYEAMRVARDRPNAYFDLCLSGMFEGVVEEYVHEAGAGKVLFGSDDGFMDPRANLGRVLFARITDPEKEMILGANLKRLLAGKLR
jgi:predicted TIM-barrel fold metal-dependent hydrolase